MLDVGMNYQAVVVERGCGRPLMTSFHSCYSFGGLAGALLGGLFAWAGISPAVNFAVVCVPLACVAIFAGCRLLAERGGSDLEVLAAAGPADVVLEDQAGNPGPHRSRMTVTLLIMALLAICSLLGEGAADGWSAVYLRDDLGTSVGLAALAYPGFSVAMAFGRLSGDRLALRFGAVTLMRCCGILAACGLTLALVSTSPAAAIAGLGYVGMLGGPVLIGGLASALGLRGALAVPVLLALLIAAGAGVVASRTAPSRPDRRK